MAKVKPLALGTGLGAILGGDSDVLSGSSALNEIELSKIEPNPNQPRVSFDEEALKELSESIKKHGVLQPIALRKVDEDKYQIVAGERRFRASKMAGLEKIPAYVKEIEGEKELLELALIENIQREDLNPIEVALSYSNLISTFNYTQEQLSEQVGKKRATIANYIRLLKLPAEIQMGLKDKKIDFGHARSIVTIESSEMQIRLYEEILSKNLSVRKVEELVRRINNGENVFEENSSSKNKESAPKKNLSEEYELLKAKLSSTFNSKIQLTCDENGKGKITIPFKSEEDLERLMDMFDKLV